MSHVDDGTLHAYLDGELSPVEVERLETHLAGCSGCRARRDEERALIERAARLLGVAVPPGPERVAPPLHQLRQPRPVWRRLRAPLAWAATIVLAVWLGWNAGSFAHNEASGPTASAPPAQTQVPEPVPSLSKATDTETGAGAPATVAPGTLADRSVREESDERRAPARQDIASATGQVAAAEAQPRARDAAPPAPPAPVAGNVVAATPSAQARVSLDDAGRRSTAWPVIEAKPARDLLGEDPVALPGYRVRALRRNPVANSGIVVEQELANGVVVSLFEQPSNQGPAFAFRGGVADSVAAKTRANERLARFIRGLRIEIAGPLPMDSLSKLLELITP